VPTRPRVGTRELLRLATHIAGAVAYRSGATTVATTAADAVALGAGVCQDHAHIFLACCHAHGIPARYVSGYIDPESTGHAASHAWVDAWAEDDDYTGWVSIDVTHERPMTEAYCRLAIGRDYESAAPVRGMRRGGGVETMRVEAQIVPLAAFA
jgi:transglutaminase-like putative cysteine protease